MLWNIYRTIYFNKDKYLYTEEQDFLTENTKNHLAWLGAPTPERAMQLAMTTPPVKEGTSPTFKNIPVVNPTVLSNQALITVMAQGMSRLAEKKL
jgi:hypothetical protein